jgi:hypothetical protein
MKSGEKMPSKHIAIKSQQSGVANRMLGSPSLK